MRVRSEQALNANVRGRCTRIGHRDSVGAGIGCQSIVDEITDGDAIHVAHDMIHLADNDVAVHVRLRVAHVVVRSVGVALTIGKRPVLTRGSCHRIDAIQRNPVSGELLFQPACNVERIVYGRATGEVALALRERGNGREHCVARCLQSFFPAREEVRLTFFYRTAE